MCLYMSKRGISTILLFVYVDNILIANKNMITIKKMKQRTILKWNIRTIAYTKHKLLSYNRVQVRKEDDYDYVPCPKK